MQSTLIAFFMDNFRYAYDCFPSLHTANPWLLVWVCRGKLPRWLMTTAIVVCTGITLSTLALRFHYGIDVLAGLTWVLLVALVARASLPVSDAHPAALAPCTILHRAATAPIEDSR
jgi:membrane-associated phospholipid phosphatase